MAGIIITLIVVATGIYLAFFMYGKRAVPVRVPAEEIQHTLSNKVAYYIKLSAEEKRRFEQEVAAFLEDIRITGVQTKVTNEDRVFVAASAIIPIFAFPGWRYPNLNEVLIYPDRFDDQFSVEGSHTDRNILGMVGSGALHRVMIIAQGALRDGFLNKTDKENTAIHEFVHLIDKTDGSIDGIPELLFENRCTKPWLQLMLRKIQEIKDNDSDINPYGATNEAEFFAVAAEYFFERPLLLQQKNPALYAKMEKIFKQSPRTDSRKQ